MGGTRRVNANSSRFYQSIDIDPNSSIHANGINVICSIILTEMSPVVWKAQEVENWKLNPFLFE